MFTAVFLPELRRRLTSPVTWGLFALVFLYTISLLLGSETAERAGGGVPRNGSLPLNYWAMYSGFWAAVFGPVLVATPLLRDLKVRMAPLVLATPIDEGAYYWGKFLAAAAGMLVVLGATTVATVVTPLAARVLALPQAVEFLPTQPWGAILATTCIWIAPAAFVYAALHFAAAALTGRMLLSYALAIACLGVFTLFFVGFRTDAAHRFWIEVLDPMGKQTLDGQGLRWTVPERAVRALAPEPALLANRLGYLALAALALVGARAAFSFPAFLERGRRVERTPATRRRRPRAPSAAAGERRLARARRTGPLRLALFLGWADVRVTVRSHVFKAVVAALVVMAASAGFSAGSSHLDRPETQLLPVAQGLLGVVQPQIFLLLATVAIYFGGEIAAREHDTRMARLVDATPAPTAVLVIGKLVAVSILALALSLLPTVSVLIVQLANGWVERFPQHFLRSAALQVGPYLLAYGWTTVAVFGVTRSRIAAQAVPAVLLWACVALHETETVENHLLLFGPPPDMLFSDFDILAASTARHLHLDAYHLSLAAAAAMVGLWLWPRGSAAGWTDRLQEARSRVSPASAAVFALALGAAGVEAVDTWRQVYLVAGARTAAQSRGDAADFERRYGGGRTPPQPQVAALALQLDLRPQDHGFTGDARWRLVNRTGAPISVLQFLVPPTLQPLRPTSRHRRLQPVGWDDRQRVGRWRLDRPLAPGEGMELRAGLQARYPAFDWSDGAVGFARGAVRLDEADLPSLGYDRSRELRARGWRRQAGLGARAAASSTRGALAQGAGQAGYVTLDLTVSAPGGMTVSASGDVVEDAVSSGRRIVRTHAEGVPLHLLVAAAPLREDAPVRAAGATVATAHLRAHGEDAAALAAAAAAALEMASARFGPPPQSGVRLVETARFARGEAPSPEDGAGGLILVPEQLGWLQDLRRAPRRDWITFSVGRQVARLWWGGRVAAAQGPGAAVIDEGVPLLLALELLERRHGIAAAEDYARLLQDHLRREQAQWDGPARPLAELDDEPFAGLQAGLGLYAARRARGPAAFDAALDRAYFQFWMEGLPYDGKALLTALAI